MIPVGSMGKKQDIVYRRYVAQATYISGGGSAIHKGMVIFIANRLGYPTYTPQEMSVEKLKSGVKVNY